MRRFPVKTRLFILIILFPLFISAQKNAWPNTLLWRISGNGLTKPSYLYGTMHMQDKRLFNFSDSTYAAIEKTEGLALEINFNELIDSMFNRELSKAEDKMLENERVKIDKRKLGKTADSILKKLGFKAENLTKKQLKEIRDYRINNISQNKEMSTIVDGYFYGIAMRMNKWLGGIEDVTDQLDLKDEIGADISPDEAFAPDEKLRAGLEEMSKTYINQDLQSIGEMSYNGFNPELTRKLLINRNIKMARRMDSLANIRSMFFAVGAAHLPGDSGVITFLKNRGFMVEPVFSSKKVDPESYAKKLANIPWKTVSDQNKLYTIEMPGEPFDANMFGEAVKMKMYFDIYNMTVFMCGDVIGNFKTDADMRKALDNFSDRMGSSAGKITDVKKINENGYIGMEGLSESISGAFKIRLLQKNSILYMLMVGSSKKSNISITDANHFFESFKGVDISANKRFEKFELPSKGLSVLMPGLPKENQAFERGADKSSWKFFIYDYSDMSNQVYFMVQVRDITGGYYLLGDSSYFSSFKDNFKTQLKTITSDTIFKYKNYPAYRLDGISNKEGIKYSTFTVIRGNRIYILMTAAGLNSDQEIINTFFNSMNFTEYPTSKWSSYSGPGFSTTALSPFQVAKSKDSSETKKNGFEHYFTYDSVQSVSYDLIKESFPKYYWSESDSSFFAEHLKTFASDSIIEKKVCYNGSLKAMDVVGLEHDMNTYKKLRVFVNGDTLYSLTAHIPIDNYKESYQFFDNFRLYNETPPSIFTDKSEALLKALKSKDSSEFEEGGQALAKMHFTKNQLPFLYKAMLNKFDLDSTDYGVSYKIYKLIDDLADTSTVNFIKENYHALDPDLEKIKYQMLILLASAKTTESYNLLGTFLKENHIPKSNKAYALQNAMTDSLDLTRKLFPELLNRLDDSAFSNVLIAVTNKLLDSNKLSIDNIKSYIPSIINTAKGKLKYADNAENDYIYKRWIDILQDINSKESNKILQDYAKLKSHYLKESAIIALVKNKLVPDPKEIEVITADSKYRLQLYESLQKLNKLNLFPIKYKTQRYLAESELYGSIDEDDEISGMTFLSEKVATYGGKKQRFYLFKVALGNEAEGKKYYLGVAGPYNINQANLTTDSSATSIYRDEDFNNNTISAQFNAYLKSLSSTSDE